LEGTTVPIVNRQWIYSEPIRGNLRTDNFSLREAPLPKIRQGQALVRNKLISLDPANRVYFAMQTYRPQIQSAM
jgi:NADPH-dependent curcumin reductase